MAVSSRRGPGWGSLVLILLVGVASLLLLAWAFRGAWFNLTTESRTQDCFKAILPVGNSKSCLELDPQAAPYSFGPQQTSTGIASGTSVPILATFNSLDLNKRQVAVRFQEQGTAIAGAPLRVVAVHPCRTPCQPEIVLASGALKIPGDPSPSELVPLQVDVDLPLDGDPRQFPGDVYVLDLFLGLWEDMPGAQGGGPVPLLLTAKTDAGIADYDVFLLRPPQASLSSYDELRLVIRRNGYQQVAVYSVMGVPLILGIILMHGFWMRRPLENFASDFLFPLAGLLLTILPLRTVFVPSQITGVTRIDYVLGYEVLILLCAAVVAYGLNLWYSRPAMASRPAPASARAESAAAAAQTTRAPAETAS